MGLVEFVNRVREGTPESFICDVNGSICPSKRCPVVAVGLDRDAHMLPGRPLAASILPTRLLRKDQHDRKLQNSQTPAQHIDNERGFPGTAAPETALGKHTRMIIQWLSDGMACLVPSPS